MKLGQATLEDDESGEIENIDSREDLEDEEKIREVMTEADKAFLGNGISRSNSYKSLSNLNRTFTSKGSRSIWHIVPDFIGSVLGHHRGRELAKHHLNPSNTTRKLERFLPCHASQPALGISMDEAPP